MTARPMTEGERRQALLSAQDIAAYGDHPLHTPEATTLLLARALLSTSAAERGMREALRRLADIADFVAQDSNIGIMDDAIDAARAALSEQARGQGRSESTDTKGTSK